MINRRDVAIDSTYERDGKWFTLHWSDSTSAVERLATADEIPVKDEPKAEKHVAPKHEHDHKAKGRK